MTTSCNVPSVVTNLKIMKPGMHIMDDNAIHQPITCPQTGQEYSLYFSGVFVTRLNINIACNDNEHQLYTNSQPTIIVFNVGIMLKLTILHPQSQGSMYNTHTLHLCPHRLHVYSSLPYCTRACSSLSHRSQPDLHTLHSTAIFYD